MSRTRAHRTALNDDLRAFFGGSVNQMLTALIRRDELDDAQLNGPKDDIERARRRTLPLGSER